MPPTNNTPPLDCFPVAYLSELVSARLLFVLLFAPAVLPAQSIVNPPPGAADDKETLVLSPFILSENKDVGYRSTNSLARKFHTLLAGGATECPDLYPAVDGWRDFRVPGLLQNRQAVLSKPACTQGSRQNTNASTVGQSRKPIRV